MLDKKKIVKKNLKKLLGHYISVSKKFFFLAAEIFRRNFFPDPATFAGYKIILK
jgi:hypothetical protein